MAFINFILFISLHLFFLLSKVQTNLVAFRLECCYFSSWRSMACFWRLWRQRVWKSPQNNIRTYLYLINISQILHRIQKNGTQNFLAKHAPRYSTSVVNSISFKLMINLSFLQGVLSSSTSKHQILKEFIKRCTEVVHLSRCVSHIVHSFFYLWGVCLLHVELLYL